MSSIWSESWRKIKPMFNFSVMYLNTWCLYTGEKSVLWMWKYELMKYDVLRVQNEIYEPSDTAV